MSGDHIIQLNLSDLRDAGNGSLAMHISWLIDQLLEIIADNAVDEDSDRDAFRTKLTEFRHNILEASGSETPSSAASSAINLCREQFKLIQAKRLKRDENFAEIIEFLRKSLISLTGDAKTFHDDLLGTTSRIKDFAELKDIQELKSKIADEVNKLNQVVAEKQKREQILYAQLSAQIATLQKKLEAAKVEASLDGLTGIANRRFFDYTVQRWVAEHLKSEEPFVIALFDLDNFKQVNDNYGHQIGDQVLAATAMEIGKGVRSSDFLARYGGEEFVVLSSGMRLAEAQKRFANLLKHIEDMRFACRNEEGRDFSISLTCSCGCAEYALGENVKDLIRRADEALYEAKRAGKNQVAIKRRPLLGAFYEGRRRNSHA